MENQKSEPTYIAVGAEEIETIETPFTKEGWVEEQLERAKALAGMSDRAYRTLFGF